MNSMKNLKQFLLLKVMTLFLIVSCQEEVVRITRPDEQAVIEANSSTATYLRRTAINDGSHDNIIDYASCLEVQLPVTVVANGETVVVENVTDFDAIEEILDAFTNDNDEVVISFPITVILSNHSEVTINSQDELLDLAEDCLEENAPDDDIECIDFQYPIAFSIYNSDFQIVETKTISTDAELYYFIDNLDGAVIASLNFPVNMVTATGEVIEVTNNQELDEAISSAEDACDEDDDNDYNDDDNDFDCTEAYVDDLLMTCHWVATSYNGDNQLADLDVYFGANQELVVTNNGVEHQGVWSTSLTTEGVVVEISQLSGGVHEDFNGVWTINNCSYDGKFIFLQDNIEMIVEKDCNQNTPACSESEITEYLDACVWNIVDFNGSNDLVNFDLDFYTGGTLLLTNGAQQGEAYWSSSLSATGNLEVEFGNVALPSIQAVNGVWKVYECAEDRIKFINESGAYFIIEKQECYSQTDFMNIINECSWAVEQFIMDGVDMTANNPYKFDFFETGFATAQNGTVIYYGNFEAENLNNGQLTFGLELYNNSELSGYYRVSQLTNDYIELVADNKELKIYRTCSSASDQDVDVIKSYLTNGTWSITYATQQSQEITAQFNGIDFNFEGNTNLVATLNNEVSTLSWNVVRDSSENLRCVINYLGENPYWDLDDDWYITAVTETRLELHHVNDAANTEFVVVFEKQ